MSDYIVECWLYIKCLGILNKEGMVDIYINIKILGESKRFVETSVCEWHALHILPRKSGLPAHFFLVTPRVLPVLPVDFVFWPLTLCPKKCLRPLLHLIFFNLSKSSLSLVSRALEINWVQLPSLISLCLFKNHLGML